MGKCNITTWKFKELPLQDPQRPGESAIASSNGNSYNHKTENELFLVGYKYINPTSCPEVKIKLSDIMQGGNGSGDGGSGSECECELALRYDSTERKLYYSLNGDTQDSRTNWISLAALDTSFNDIVFDWVEEESDQEAYVEGGKLHLKLKKQTINNPGGGGEDTFPSTFPVTVLYDVAEGDDPNGTYSDGRLTLHLVPVQNGINGEDGEDGQDGQDGASFKLYKVKLDFTSSPPYEPKVVTNGITVYKLNASQIWYKYEPNSNTYTKIKTKPTIGNAYVEVGPSDIWKTGTGWNAVSNYYIPGLNAHFNTFGFYNYSNQTFEFYSAGDPAGIGSTANTPLQFSVKVYENIKSADDETAGSGDDPVTPDDPQPSTPEYYYTEDGDVEHKVSLYTNENLPEGTVTRDGDDVYYLIPTEAVLYDGNTLLVYIPNDKKISGVYALVNRTWTLSTSADHLDYWVLKENTILISGNEYKVYGYRRQAGTGYAYGRNSFSFDIVNDTSDANAPSATVSEHDTDNE